LSGDNREEDFGNVNFSIDLLSIFTIKNRYQTYLFKVNKSPI